MNDDYWKNSSKGWEALAEEWRTDAYKLKEERDQLKEQLALSQGAMDLEINLIVDEYDEEIRQLQRKLYDVEAERDQWKRDCQLVVDRWKDVAEQWEMEYEIIADQLTEARQDDRTAMGYLSEIRELVGGKDFPDMVARIEALVGLFKSKFDLGDDNV